MTDDERLLQIKRAHASRRPSDANPAWKNSHSDLGFVLAYLEAARDQRQYATEIALTNALSKLIDKIHTGLDSGDILEDAETAMESLDRATAEQSIAAQDAKRYRWLRDVSEPGICAFYLSVGKAFDGVKFTQETVDQAIDAQIKSQQDAAIESQRSGDRS